MESAVDRSRKERQELGREHESRVKRSQMPASTRLIQCM